MLDNPLSIARTHTEFRVWREGVRDTLRGTTTGLREPKRYVASIPVAVAALDAPPGPRHASCPARSFLGSLSRATFGKQRCCALSTVPVRSTRQHGRWLGLQRHNLCGSTHALALVNYSAIDSESLAMSCPRSDLVGIARVSADAQPHHSVYTSRHDPVFAR